MLNRFHLAVNMIAIKRLCRKFGEITGSGKSRRHGQGADRFLYAAVRICTAIIAFISVLCVPLTIDGAKSRVQDRNKYVSETRNANKAIDVDEKNLSDIKSNDVPAVANTLRFLFNTIAISAFIFILLLAAIRLLKSRILAANKKRVLEQQQRKRVEANLDRQRAHLLTILGVLLDIYILVDRDGVCEAVVNNKNDPWWPK